LGDGRDLTVVQRCRICDLELNETRNLTLSGLPASAQGFLTKQDLKADKSLTLDITECSGCGVVQTRNPPVPYFREVIRASGYSPEMQAHREQQFKKFLNDYHLTEGRILEVGCGKGENLTIVASLGVESFGIEYGEQSISYLHQLGLNAARVFFDTGDEHVPGAPYDGFIFLNFLEHIPNPREVFAGIHKNLKDQAVGLIEVPNFDMILEESMFTEFVSDHIFYFSRNSLKTVLRCNGFDVLECCETWHRYTISAVVRRRKFVDFSEMTKLTSQLKEAVGQFCEKYQEEKIVVWGAGHQALTVMAISGIQEKVRYVVDSAPFKQNRYTPGTHLPIVAPEVFFSDSVGAVLVIAGSYTQEVCEIIRRRGKNSIKIGVLDGVAVRSVEETAEDLLLRN